ncbi:glycosyltransferase family 39 protein [Marininema halotolerans]|uniref:Dolichyl-phosphate-mannose-protein mannosyltransferase n=1 Tax=Marininema halotolerans TaxID=1155944 RepID=A0A1I6SI90_9BACL|nr:glycosyltransferase family 39 protein [Marininema halotolerans]SFS76666.1 Dolichyl-phosphate-mannose-protein mannosyltransferase [Marininema halotolerans]
MKSMMKRIDPLLFAILILATLLSAWNLSQVGYGNTYYAVTVKSMLESAHNFFFASYDAGGFVTVDKPPVALWIQAASAWIFGFSGWSILLPQVIAAVLSVALLYRLVAKRFGRTSGLIAALILALSPISVAVSRTNNLDTLLILVLLIATATLLRAAERGSVKWLLVTALIVGIGFNIKMLQAYLVLPAFFFVYLFGTRLSWGKKVLHLGLATILLVGVSLSWAVAVDATPKDQRPYIGSSENNTVMQLIVGHNGASRWSGPQHGGGGKGADGGGQALKDGSRPQMGGQDGPPPGGQGGSPPNGQPGQDGPPPKGKPGQGGQPDGKNRMGGGGPGGQSETGTPGLLRLFSSQLAGQIAWFLGMALFSIIALVRWKRPSLPLGKKASSVLLWVGWMLPMIVFFSFASFFHRYYLATLAPGIAALVGIGLPLMWKQYRQHVPGLKGWLLPLSLLVTGGVQSWILWGQRETIYTLPSVGMLVCTLLGVGTLLLLRHKKSVNRLGKQAVAGMMVLFLIAPLFWSITPIIHQSNNGLPAAGPELLSTHQQGRGPGKNQVDNKLISYLKKNHKNEKYWLAVDSSMQADPYALKTDRPIMAMGGFNGGDPILTVDKLKQMVDDGEVRYFLISTGEQNRQGPPQSSKQTAVTKWLQENGTVVPTKEWQSDSNGRNNQQLIEVKQGGE